MTTTDRVISILIKPGICFRFMEELGCAVCSSVERSFFAAVNDYNLILSLIKIACAQIYSPTISETDTEPKKQHKQNASSKSKTSPYFETLRMQK